MLFNNKNISLATIFVFIVLFMFSGISMANTGFDLAITNVEKTSCKQPLSVLDDKGTQIYMRNNIEIGGESFYVIINNPPDLDMYLSGKWSLNGFLMKENENYGYKLLEVAPDLSHFRYIIKDESQQSVYRTTCLKIDFDVSGDLSQFQLVDETKTPKSGMEQFFNFIKNIGLNFTFVLDPVKKIEGVTPFAYYKRDTAMILPKTLQPGKNTLYASIAFPETDTDSGGDMNLIVAMNNSMTSVPMFDRTFWNGVRDGTGPTIPEKTMANNYFKIKKFLKTGTDYPKRPNVEIVAKNKNTLELAWKPVGPDNTYIVYHSRDNLQIIEFDKLFNQTTQKDTTFSLPLATTGNFYDFVTVIAVNKNGIMGPPSSELGYGNIFSDVDPDIWYGKYAKNAYSSGLMQGYIDEKTGNPMGVFGPTDKITKAQALKMASLTSNRFIRSGQFNFPLPYSIPKKFDNHWAKEYILSGYILNFDLLKDIEKFNPDEPIFRGELMHLLTQAFEAKPKKYPTYSFSDVQTSPYADDIQFFHDLGVVSGYDNTTTFGTSNPLLRSEAVKIFIESGKAFELSWPEQFQN